MNINPKHQAGGVGATGGDGSGQSARDPPYPRHLLHPPSAPCPQVLVVFVLEVFASTTEKNQDLKKQQVLWIYLVKIGPKHGKRFWWLTDARIALLTVLFISPHLRHLLHPHRASCQQVLTVAKKMHQPSVSRARSTSVTHSCVSFSSRH